MYMVVCADVAMVFVVNASGMLVVVVVVHLG